MITELNENNFDENIAGGLKIVYFYAPWCGFCGKQTAILNDMKDVNLYKVNGDDNPKLILSYGIKAFPAFLIFKNGKVLNKISGLRSKFELMNIIVGYLKS